MMSGAGIKSMSRTGFLLIISASLAALFQTGCDISGHSKIKVSLPAAPGPLAATAASFRRINLFWTDNSNNESRFVIERAPDVEGSAGTFSEIAAVPANMTEYSNSGLAESTVYHYRVCSRNSAGSSAYSNNASGETPEQPEGGGQIIADHTVVDDYLDIPPAYITAVKKMYLNVPGESHSSGYRIGLDLLMAADDTGAYDVVVTESGSPEAYREDALRVDRLVRNMYGGWSEGAGEAVWYAWHAWDTGDEGYPPDHTDTIRNHITYCHDNDLAIAAIGFGWCWDMTWQNAPGGDADSEYGVRWAGSSEGGPDGNLRWGLDDADNLLTGNSVNMDDYLAATGEYITHCATNSPGTKVFFTTGPVDGNSGTENGYQREIKHQYIRDYVLEDGSRILFDYADILCWNNAGVQSTSSWNGHVFPGMHPDNMLDLDGSYSEDGDHIGEAGSLRLGKALWWMLARIAGWDGVSE